MAGPSIAQRTILRGRTDHQTAIAALLNGAADGCGGALLLHGEVGVGKSALLAEAACLAGSGAYTNLAEAKSLSHKGSGPAARRTVEPPRDPFTVLTTGGNEKEAQLRFAGLHRLLGPVLEHLSALPPTQAGVLATAIESGECAGADSFALSAAVLGLLRAAATSGPVLCCVDDAQWVDQPSLDALAFVARRVATDRIALLFAMCDSSGWFDAEPGGGPVDPIAGVPSLTVPELDHRTSRDILTDLVPDGLAGDVAGVLAGVAGGNPLALADLARSLTPEQRRGEAGPPTSLPPDSALRRAIRVRLRRLPAETRWLVLLAATDADLDVGSLVRAAAESGVGLDALEPAELSNVIRVHGTALRFPQPLVRSIVYDEATLAQRRAAHTLLANTLDPDRDLLRRSLHRAAVAAAPDPALADELVRAAAEQPAARAAASRALECAAALTGDPVAAATHLVTAARLAWEGGEPHRARMLLRRVPRAEIPHHVRAQAELLLGEIEMRAGATTHARQTLLAAADDLSEDRHLALNALMRAGEALCLTGDYGRYAELASYALELREATEPPRLELLFEQFAGLTAMFNGSFGAGMASLRRVLELASELDDPLALIRASMAAVVLGDDAQAYRLAIRAVSVARATGDVSAVPQALELAAAAEIALGRYAAATATLLAGLPLARETGQETLASNISATLALIAATMGDKESCLHWVRDARSHAPSQGVNRCQAIIDWALALLDLMAGRPAEALARLQALMLWKSGRGQIVIQIAATPHLVEAAVRCGERGAALRPLAMFESWAERTDNPAWLAVLARCHALVAESEEEADHYFREALRHHQAGESEFERARTELLYGQELRRARRPSAAREHLRSALESFQRFEAEVWVAQASAELRAAGDHIEHRSVSLADALTPQQMQIARLAAAGATNREVAKQMFLSTRTVDHHMRNIFARLGIRSRVDLAKLMS